MTHSAADDGQTLGVPELLHEVTRTLTDAKSPSPAAEARTLLAHVLDLSLGDLPLAPGVSSDQARRVRGLVDQRAAGQPLQHLTGTTTFRYADLRVGPGVFVPRPETEVMTGWAVDWLRGRVAVGVDHPVVVELGTGSGAISAAISDEVPQAQVHAVELSDDALAWAARNLAGRPVELRHGDLAEAFNDLNGQVDLVISNPPYIPLERWEDVAVEVRTHEPHLALFSGPDGLDAIRSIAQVARRLLRLPTRDLGGGVVTVEHAEVQHRSAPRVFVEQGGFVQITDHRDLAGRPRFLTATRADSGRMER